MRSLKTTSAIIDALGGTSQVAHLTGRRLTQVSNWRRMERFPANTFLTMAAALKAAGCAAPPALWGMKARPETSAEVA